MNQPEQPIEALLDEVDALIAKATPAPLETRLGSGHNVCTALASAATGSFDEFVCDVLPDYACRPGKSPRWEANRNLIQAVYSILPRLSRELRQRIEREQRLMQCPECNWQTSELTASAREESPCPNCGKRTLGQFIQQPATTKPRQQLEQQQQSGEMK